MKNFFSKVLIFVALLGMVSSFSPQVGFAQSDGPINIGISPAQEKKMIDNMSPANRKRYDNAIKKNAKCVRGLILAIGGAAYVGANPKGAALAVINGINGCL